MAAPAISLHYFAIKGRAEAIRLAFHIGGIKFEDVRFSFAEWGQSIKATAELGVCPWLVVDGKRLFESNAILVYAGRLAKLISADPFQEAKTIEVLEACEDLANLVTPSMREPDVAKRIAVRETLVKGALGTAMKQLDGLLTTAGGNYFVGGQLSIADLKMACVCNWFSSGTLDGFPADFVSGFPALAGLANRVNQHPKVAEWNAAHA